MTARHTIKAFDLNRHDLPSLKCRLAEQVYHKYIRDAYGIKDCCLEYDHNEVNDLKLEIALLSSGLKCEHLRKLDKEQLPSIDVSPIITGKKSCM